MAPYFLESGQAQAMTVTSSTFSAASSLLIISIILRSPSKLSSSYHKIMFSLSSWDALSSFAMALSTLPMSKDVLDVYEFVGVVIGNAGTCTAQGFAVTTGLTFAMCANVTLSIYYVCTIRYKMTDQTVKKKLLPIMVAFSCLVGLPVCITPLVMGLYNPRPFEPYCYIGSYPYRCNRDPILDREKGVSCIRGDVPAATEDKVFLVTMIGIGVGFFLMVVSLVMVVMSVFQTEMAVRRVLKEEGIEDENANDTPLGNTTTRTTTSSSTRNRRGRRRIMDDFQETRTILRFALMYIGAFFLTWIWTIITMTVYINNSTVRSILDYGKLIFNPSQGTFNALIFIYNRVHIARQVKPNLTFSQALQMVLFTPSIVPEILVSSLDVVENDRNQREQEGFIHLGHKDLGHHDNVDECESDLSSRSSDGNDDFVSDRFTVIDEENNRIEREISLPSRIRKSTFSSEDLLSPHPPNLSEIKVTNNCPSFASTLTQERSTRGLGLSFGNDDDLSLTPEEQSQLSMNVQRKGEGHSPKKTSNKMLYTSNHSGPSLSSNECVSSSSIPSGVILKNVNENISCGIISSMVKSFDESGSFKCVREEDEERSLSVCDLSGFELASIE